MKLKEVNYVLNDIAPFILQEDYDNSGIQIGDKEAEINSALLALDCTEEVIDEAIKKSCNLIITHHPLIFGGINSIGNDSMTDRIIRKSIKEDISILAIHTNLDNLIHGVNSKIAERIGLEKSRILKAKKGALTKLVFFCPSSHSDKVKSALFKIGAGEIGEYSECSYSSEGVGTFKPSNKANPTLGKANERHSEKEDRIEIIFPSYLESQLIQNLKESHPYEETAFDLIPLLNKYEEVGSGMIGELKKPIKFGDFLKTIKESFNIDIVRHTKVASPSVSKVAFCGGSGSFLLKDAIAQGAEVFISADFKYHQFFEAEDRITIMDIGHYESEQFTPSLLQALLKEKIPNFVTHLSSINTNPIIYS